MAYNFDDLVEAYNAVGLTPGRTVYVLSAIWQVANYGGDQAEIVDAHYMAIREIIGAEGTIAVSTATMNLCNTDIPFDPQSTPSFNAGAFSEYVRTINDSKRSYHPFGSYAAIGPDAEYIVENVSRYMFGPETPESRLIELDALQLNIGLPPTVNSTVGHVEQVMAVPYRYAKEFVHPVVRKGKSVEETFYMFVRRLDVDVNRNHCQRLFERLNGNLMMNEQRVGSGKICSYSMADFYREAVKVFAKDVYVWCEAPPSNRPYRN